MRSYETTFIINPQTDDATIEKHVNDVASIITDNKGNILHKDLMGTRRLAYEINNLTHGYYTSIIFEGESSILTKLDRHFKLNEAYIRSLTVRFEGSLEDLNKDILFNFKTGDDSNDENRVKDSSTSEKVKEEVSTEETSEDVKSEEESTDEPIVEEDDSDEKVETDESQSVESTDSSESEEEEL